MVVEVVAAAEEEVVGVIIEIVIVIPTIIDHGHVHALLPPVAVVVMVVEVADVDVNVVVVDRMIDMGVEGVEVRDGVDVA